MSIALSAAVVSWARRSIVRDTVGSEATNPNTAALAAEQRDIGEAVPTDRETKREIQQHFGGWCTANGAATATSSPSKRVENATVIVRSANTVKAGTDARHSITRRTMKSPH